MKMRLWNWFLLILLAIGLILVFVGEYGLGWELSLYGTIILSFLFAVGMLYFERWIRRLWQK